MPSIGISIGVDSGGGGGGVAAPSFDVAAGTYAKDQSISLSAAGGMTIYYTTDGSDPDTGSSVYSTPISVASVGTTTTIKAIAIDGGGKSSPVASATYAIARAVFIMAGQSNMTGDSAIAGAHADEQVADTRVAFWYVVGDPATDSSGGAWIDLQGWNSNTAFGPELTFGRSLADLGYHIAIIKYAVNGSGLAARWLPADADLYPNLTTQITTALAALTDPYVLTDANGIGGLVWVGCETDATASAAVADAITANLGTFVGQLRTDLSEPALPVIVSRLSDLQTAVPYLSNGRAAIDAYGVAEPLSTIVDTDASTGNSIKSDNEHFDKCGKQTHGKLLARAVDASAAPAKNQTRMMRAALTSTPVNQWRQPEFTTVRALLQAAGGGGATNAGAGGSGAYVTSDPTGIVEDLIVLTAPAASAADTDGGIATVSTAVAGVLAQAAGGKSHTNGGAGGAAADCIGDTKRDGVAGGSGTGNQNGGGAPSIQSAASGTTPGEPWGGKGNAGTAGTRVLGAGGGSASAAQQGGAQGLALIAWNQDALSGYARVRSRSWGRSTADGTSLVANMPGAFDGGAAPQAGDTLLIVVWSDGNPTIGCTGSGSVTQVGSQVANTTAAVSMTAFTMPAAGGGADTLTVTTSAAEAVAYEVWCLISAGAVEIATVGGSSSTASPDPPSITPSGGAGNYLVIASAALDGAAIGPVISVPTGYASGCPHYNGQLGAGGPYACAAEAFANGSSFNPGTFGFNTSTTWVAATISVAAA